MKKNYLFSVVLGAMMMAPAATSAQYIKEAPAGGFNFSQGKDYVVIYAPEKQVEAMGSRVLSNQNLDPTMTNNYFSYWVADWDKTLFTLYNCEDTQKNSWGGSEKLNMTPLFGWGSGQFTTKGSFKYDLSAITDDHILHIGFMNIGGEGKEANFQFSLGPEDNNGFKLEVNKGVGTPIGNFVGVGTATERNKWYYLDIPLSVLIDEDGDFGFEYDFSEKISGPIFTCGFDVDDASLTEYTAGNVDPDTGMKTITIKQIGSALAIDHVFLYKVDPTGIQNTKTATGNEVRAIYDLTGRQVNDYRPGVNIVKTANGVKKVIRK